MDKSVKFKDFDCIAKLSKYSDTNQPSLRLIDKEDGLPVANASLNLSLMLFIVFSLIPFVQIARQANYTHTH